MNIEKIKEMINDYTIDEFEHEADFSDPTDIGLAYTTLTDYEIPIQVSIDISNMVLLTYIGSDEPDETNLVDEYKIVDEDELGMMLDFDSLISGWTSYIEHRIHDYI